MRFNLSAEAGFNDSLAFPFVYLAIVLSSSGDGDLLKWLGVDVVWKILAGVAMGWIVGRLGAKIAFKEQSGGGKEPDERVDDSSEGLLVIAALLFSYGAGELVNGYGFLSVFVAAVTAKQREVESDLHKETHGFVDQIERVVMVVILIGFGGLLASGVLNALSWPGVIVGTAFLLIIRPLSGLIAMGRSGLPFQGKLAVAFLGVRGVGSFYYLAYGQHHATFGGLAEIWSTISFTVLLSIVIHGVTAGKILNGIGERNRIKKGYRSGSTTAGE